MAKRSKEHIRAQTNGKKEIYTPVKYAAQMNPLKVIIF
jgi:hypothetical protein